MRRQAGLLGDVQLVGGGGSELRLDHGPGYRTYFVPHVRLPIIPLRGGDEGSQQQDIT